MSQAAPVRHNPASPVLALLLMQRPQGPLTEPGAYSLGDMHARFATPPGSMIGPVDRSFSTKPDTLRSVQLFRTERLALTASVCALVGSTLCLIAVGRVADWQIQLGPLGTWVGGLGTAAAACMAYVTLRQLLRTRREQQIEQQDRVAEEHARATRRAGRVQVRTIPGVTATMTPGWSVTLTNRSGRPIHDVKWNKLVAMRPDPPETLTEFICLPANSEFADYVPFILDSDSRGVEYLARPPEIRESHYSTRRPSVRPVPPNPRGPLIRLPMRRFHDLAESRRIPAPRSTAARHHSSRCCRVGG